MFLLLACIKTSPPPPGLVPERVAGLAETPRGCFGAWVVLARTEVCQTPCLREGELYPEGDSEALPRKQVRCAFHQLPGDRHGSWVIESRVPLQGRHACITEQGEWLVVDMGLTRSTPGVVSRFGLGKLTLDLESETPATWSEVCVPTDGSPLLQSP